MHAKCLQYEVQVGLSCYESGAKDKCPKCGALYKVKKIRDLLNIGK